MKKEKAYKELNKLIKHRKEKLKANKIIICPSCGTRDVELQQCEYCLNIFCCECIDEHKRHCPERDD